MLEGDKFYKKKQKKDTRGHGGKGGGQVAIFNRVFQISGLTEKVRFLVDGHCGTLNEVRLLLGLMGPPPFSASDRLILRNDLDLLHKQIIAYI